MQTAPFRNFEEHASSSSFSSTSPLHFRSPHLLSHSFSFVFEQDAVAILRDATYENGIKRSVATTTDSKLKIFSQLISFFLHPPHFFSIQPSRRSSFGSSVGLLEHLRVRIFILFLFFPFLISF